MTRKTASRRASFAIDEAIHEIRVFGGSLKAAMVIMALMPDVGRERLQAIERGVADATIADDIERMFWKH